MQRDKIAELYRMAKAYEYGSEVCSRNVDKAIEYYQILADMGESQAISKIRELSPAVVAKANVVETRKYQSSRGNIGSLNNPQNSQLYELAQRFEYGTDVCAKNLNRAVEFYKILADRGEEIAVRKLKELGVSYRVEIPSKKVYSDSNRPVMYSTGFADGIKSDKIKELYRMANAYEYGSEVCSRNVGKAIEYYQILADMGESQAISKIRELSPAVVAKPNVAASGMYQSSRGNSGSLNNPQNSQLYEMAQRFEYGSDVCAKNLNRAIEYYKILADKGEEIAVRKLEELSIPYQGKSSFDKVSENCMDSLINNDELNIGENSREIYQKILAQFDCFIDNLNSGCKSTRNKKLKKFISELIDYSDGRRSELKNRINNLEKNAEWDKFVIAFYGETNAGKSTIIETLRIILNEKTKICERKEGKYDGEIIGDGRSDFTKKNVSYECQIGEEKFILEDVPGIEGNEESVKEEILKAVRKDHVVFYITRSLKKPEEGTLKKIREHLQEQTEVWTIYNRNINSPGQLNGCNSMIDANQLREIHQTMYGLVGEEHYRGEISLSAKPAFLAVADMLEPESDNAKKREKFLKGFTQEQLLEKSQFEEFYHILERDIICDCKKKIKSANYNKISELIEQYAKEVYSQLKRCKTEKSRMADSYYKFQKKVCNEFEHFNRNLDNAVKNSVIKWKNDKVKIWYETIKQGIKDEDLKQQLGTTMATAGLQQCIQEAYGERVRDFDKKIRKLEKEYSESLEKSFGSIVAITPQNSNWKLDSVLLSVVFAPIFSKEEVENFSNGLNCILEKALGGDNKVALIEAGFLFVLYGGKYAWKRWFEKDEARWTRQKGVVNNAYTNKSESVLQGWNSQMQQMLEEKRADVLQTYQDPQLIMDEVICSLQNIVEFLRNVKRKIRKEIQK